MAYFEIHNCEIPLGHPNRSGEASRPMAVIIHYTANENPGATDTANANYFRRKYIEKNKKYYEADGITPFRYGSAHAIIDCDSISKCIPYTECCWGCGDRPNPYNNGYKGQTAIAKNIFGHNQNYRSIQFELCNNKDWNTVVNNAIIIVADTMNKYNISNDRLYRHYDITGKSCPLYFIKTPLREQSWLDFKTKVVIMRDFLKKNPNYYDNFISGKAVPIKVENGNIINVTNPSKITSENKEYYSVYGLKTNSKLNVRDRASTKGKVLGKINKNGVKVNIIELEKDFYKCYGYINKYYIKDNKVNTPNSNLNVRLNDNISSPIIFKLNDKTTITPIQDLNNGWIKIVFYISKNFLKK